MSNANEEELTRLRESHDGMKLELARLREAALLREAGEYVGEVLKDVHNVPDFTKARIQAAAAANPPVKEGALDREALKARVEESVTAEAAYLARVTGAGEIRGFGPATPVEPKLEELQASLTESFGALLPENAAKIAAAGR